MLENVRIEFDIGEFVWINNKLQEVQCYDRSQGCGTRNLICGRVIFIWQILKITIFLTVLSCNKSSRRGSVVERINKWLFLLQQDSKDLNCGIWNLNLSSNLKFEIFKYQSNGIEWMESSLSFILIGWPHTICLYRSVHVNMKLLYLETKLTGWVGPLPCRPITHDCLIIYLGGTERLCVIARYHPNQSM
jgi:hypothetical protein